MGIVFRNLTLSYQLVASLALIVVRICLLRCLLVLAKPCAAEKQGATKLAALRPKGRGDSPVVFGRARACAMSSL
jgi:hypothetical protein